MPVVDRVDRSEFVSAPAFLPEVVVSAVGYRAVEPTPMLHRGLPSPALTMVFSLDEPIVSGWSPEQATGADAFRDHIVLGGLHERPAYIAQPCVQTGIQLAIRPSAARAMFGAPATELAGRTMDAVDVFGPSVAALRTRLEHSDSWSQRFRLLADYLRQRCAMADRRPRPEVIEAWKWIARHRGAVSVADLAEHVLLSQRQLSTVFRAEFGITPKAASRLVRSSVHRSTSRPSRTPVGTTTIPTWFATSSSTRG